ncbi:alpha/beta hydrolase [Candidatus Uabimicrobium sp. HlEnr_7]|uniref:alpha/beta hydrolase n=1 Tax=Candidatus Uabimicrobium helgolandensis TaxID=3095367 RepID=UPI003555F5B7
MKAYMFLIVFFISSCGHLFFHPHRNQYTEKSKQIVFQTKDGYQLQGRILRNSLAKCKGVVIHFHGNAANMDNHQPQVEWLTTYGYDVFMFDYRGYGESEGTASRYGLLLDSEAAIDFVISQNQWKQIYLFGQSLGGNQAISALNKKRQKHIDAIVIDSSFYTYASVANDMIGGCFFTYPLTWSLVGGNCYSAASHLPHITTPIFIFHGKNDKVIDISHGYNLYEIANEPKKFMAVDNCRHLYATGKSHVRQQMMQFLDLPR